MTSIHVSITVAPENVEKFLDALKPVYDAVVAEPNCTLFQVFHKAEEPGVFRFVENWNATVDWLVNVLHIPPSEPFPRYSQPVHSSEF
jgi:hypothetical protein